MLLSVMWETILQTNLLGLRGILGAHLHRLDEDGVFGIQHVEAVLGEIAGADVVTGVDRPCLDRHDAGEDLEQRGLARAVASDDSEDLSLLNVETHIVESPDRLSTCTLRDMGLERTT